MKKIIESILHFRILILSIILLLTLFFGFFIKNLKVNADFLSYLPKDDPTAMMFNKVGETFGGNYMGVISVTDTNIFDKAALKTIQSITDTLSQAPGISSVNSLTNIIDIKTQDGMVYIDNLISDLPETKAESDSLKEYTLSKDLYRNVLVSQDGTTSIIAVKFQQRLKEMIDTTLSSDSLYSYYSKYYPEPIYNVKITGDSASIFVDKMKVVENIKKIIKSKNYPQVIQYGGLPFLTKEIGDIIFSDILRLIPLAFLIIVIVLWFGFKKISEVVIPLLNVGIAIIWTLGIMGMFHFDLTMVSNTIPVILLAVGSAYSIHVINHFRETQAASLKEKITTSISQVAVPVVFASITTIVGFLSFIFGSYLTMISNFGLFSAMGIFFSLLLSLILTPILQSFGKWQAKQPDGTIQTVHSPLGNLLKKLGYSIHQHPKYYLIFWGIIIGIFIIFAFKVERNVNLLNYLKKDNPARLAEENIRQKFGGTTPIYLVVSDSILTPKTLKEMEKAKTFLNSLPYIQNTQSVADFIKEMNKNMGDGDKIPGTQNKIDNLWFLLDGQPILNQFITPNHDQAVIQGIVTTTDSKTMRKLVKKVNTYIAKHPNIRQTGFSSIYSQLDQSILDSQRTSLIISILLVLILIGFLLKGFSKGVLAIIPILTTLTVLFGFMGLAGISLDVATVLVGSVSIGIGIDYAIHFITGFEYHYKRTKNKEQALSETMQTTGKGIVINMISVTLGFMVLLFAQLVPVEYFGLLVSVTMIVSSAATLTLLPAFIFLNKKYK